MKFGGLMVFTEQSMSGPDLARALEERGFESVWAPEHSHIPASRDRVAWIRGAGAITPTLSGSGDADIIRVSQRQHAVQDLDRNRHFARPALVRARA